MIFEFERSAGTEFEYFVAAERFKSWYVMSIIVADQSGAQNEVEIEWKSIPSKLIRMEGQTAEGEPNENSLKIVTGADAQRGVPLRAEKMQHITMRATGAFDIHFDVIEADLTAADKRILELSALSDLLDGEYPFQRIIETDDN